MEQIVCEPGSETATGESGTPGVGDDGAEAPPSAEQTEQEPAVAEAASPGVVDEDRAIDRSADDSGFAADITDDPQVLDCAFRLCLCFLTI